MLFWNPAQGCPDTSRFGSARNVSTEHPGGKQKPVHAHCGPIPTSPGHDAAPHVLRRALSLSWSSG